MFKKSCIILCILIAFTFIGCGNKGSSAQKQSSQGGNNTEKLPEQLKSIEKSLEEIFMVLNGPVSTEEKGSQDEKSESKNENKDKKPKEQDNKSQDSKKGQEDEGADNKEKDKKNSGGEDKEQKGKSDQGKGDQQQTAQKKEDPWSKIPQTIEKLHAEWSDYTPLAIKAGASRELRDNFAKALNNLTVVAGSKDPVNTMSAANNVYGYFSDLCYLYRTKVSPEMKKVKFYARDGVIASMKKNWTQADTATLDLNSSWEIMNANLDKKYEEEGLKIKSGIYELEKVIKERNQQLTTIKGKLLLKNIGTLEKSVSEQSSK